MKLRQWIWFLLGVLALLIRGLGSNFPVQTDKIYSRGLFPYIRITFDYTLGKLPFPSVFLFIAFILLLILLFFRGFYRKKGLKQRLSFFFRAILNFAGGLLFFFMLLWGFNYQRTPVSQQLGLSAKPLELHEMKAGIEENYRELLLLRQQLKSDTLPIVPELAYQELESEVRDILEDQLPSLGLSFLGKPRTKLFPPPGLMRRLGILGIYFPYVGESYIDPTLHPLEKPFTIAHEMAHSFGVTDEGEANFVAWVVGSQSKNPLLGYSASLRLFLYQVRDYYRMAPDEYLSWIQNLDRGVLNDIRSIQERAAQYPPFSLEISRKTNDLFLKSQGVKSGVLSYQELPMLVKAWKEKKQFLN
ncbi:DUF3810 domain-containing protein [uncultured Algoriphagus sp.]|uniref:DUF3810 domain-containing protein n=1 Tax=uncultured Algoriphagus sp. TaxID=417365 RepID=UPI0025976E5F|nr:DUF3810 domain-containing protein [uncultured Algoriphagus sp.]